MGLSSIAKVTITTNSRGISQKGFGTLCVLAKHSNFPELIKEYDGATALGDMVSDGFTTNDPAYRAVASTLGAETRVTSVKVGRLLTKFTHLAELSIKATTPVASAVYKLTVITPAGVSVPVSHTVTAGQTQAQVASAVAALIDAITGISATATLGVISCTADNDNEMWIFDDYDLEMFDYKDITADESNLVSEFIDIFNVDSDFYAFTLADCPSKARLMALGTHAETQDLLFGATTFDTETQDTAVTDDVISTAKSSSLYRTVVEFSGHQRRNDMCAWLGDMLPRTPGNATWAFKELRGNAYTALKNGAQNAIEAKNGNYYSIYRGAALTFPGKVAGGEWIDIIRFRDWCVARMLEGVVQLLASTPKIPYTNKGAKKVTNVVRTVLNQGAINGGIDVDGEIIVTHPDVRTVPAATRKTRLLPNIYFSAPLAGAIHLTEISGTLEV